MGKALMQQHTRLSSLPSLFMPLQTPTDQPFFAEPALQVARILSKTCGTILFEFFGKRTAQPRP